MFGTVEVRTIAEPGSAWTRGYGTLVVDDTGGTDRADSTSSGRFVSHKRLIALGRSHLGGAIAELHLSVLTITFARRYRAGTHTLARAR